MQAYIGVKLANGKPMTRLEYSIFRGWELPGDENGNDEGYLVEYLDGGTPNTDEYNGYVSWSPAEQFDNAYRLTNKMNFGLAIEAMRKGFKVARKGWNGKKMFLIYVGGTKDCEMRENTPYHTAMCPDITGQTHVDINPHIDMMTATGEFQPGWLASQTDMLADDWEIID